MKKITIILETDSEEKRIMADLKNHLEKESLKDALKLKSIEIEEIEE